MASSKTTKQLLVEATGVVALNYHPNGGRLWSHDMDLRKYESGSGRYLTNVQKEGILR